MTYAAISIVIMVLLTIVGLIAAVVDRFYILPIALTSIILFASFIFFKRSNLKLEKPNATLLATSLLFVILAIFIGMFHHETFTSARDEGIYSNAAAYLATHHTFKTNDTFIKSFYGFETANEGTVLSVSPGYIIWLALFYSVFGITGFYIANSVLYFCALTVLYSLVRVIHSNKAALFTIILVFLDFNQMWLFRRTLSETLMQPLIWYTVFLMIITLKQKSREYALLTLISALLITFVRPDGFIYSLSASSVLFFTWYQFKKKQISKRELLKIGGIIATLAFIIGMLLLKIGTIKVDLIKTFFFALFDFFSPADFFMKHSTEYIFIVLKDFMPIALFLALFAPFFTNIRHNKKIWTIALLIAPGLFILLVPGITPDLPWFMRRYMPTIVPLIYILAVLVIFEIKEKYSLTVAVIITAIMVSISLLTTLPIAFFSAQRGLTTQLRAITDVVGPNDVLWVIMNRVDTRNWVSGGVHNFAPPLQFLFQRKTVIKRNVIITPEELQKASPNGEIYILSTNSKNITGEYPSDPNLIFPDSSLQLVKEININVEELEFTCQIFQNYILPSEQGKFTFDYQYVRNSCYGNLPHRIVTNAYPLRLYKVK